MHPQQLIIFGVMAVVFIALFSWRITRMMRATPFNPYRAWVLPLILLLLAGSRLAAAWPLSVMAWVWVAVAVVVGGALGWLRGKSISMTYDQATRQVFAQGGATAIIFIVVLILVRVGLTFYLQKNSASIGVSVAAGDVIVVALGAALFAARSVELGLRGHKLIVANAGVLAPPVADAP